MDQPDQRKAARDSQYKQVEWENWPRGLRHCNQNQKVLGSNPTRCSAEFTNPLISSFLVTFESNM